MSGCVQRSGESPVRPASRSPSSALNKRHGCRPNTNDARPSIRLAYLGDLQRYADAQTGSPASIARRLRVVKSLLSFAARMGFTPFNIGAAIRPPRPDDRLAERILDERQVFVLLDAVADQPRDHALNSPAL